MTLGRDTHQEGLPGTSSLSTSERLYNNVVPSFLLIPQLSFIPLWLPGIRREGRAGLGFIVNPLACDFTKSYEYRILVPFQLSKLCIRNKIRMNFPLAVIFLPISPTHK